MVTLGKAFSLLGLFISINGTLTHMRVDDPGENVALTWDAMVGGSGRNPYDTLMNIVKYPLTQFLLPDNIFFPPNGPFKDRACRSNPGQYNCKSAPTSELELKCGTSFATQINAINGTAYKVYWFDYISQYTRVDFSTCDVSASLSTETSIDTVIYIVNNTVWGGGGSYNNFKQAGEGIVPRNPIKLITSNDDTYVPKVCTSNYSPRIGSGSLATLSTQTINGQYGYYAIIVGAADEQQVGTIELQVTCVNTSETIRTLYDDFPVAPADMVITNTGGLKGSFECGTQELTEIGYDDSIWETVIAGSTSLNEALHYFTFDKKSIPKKNFLLTEIIIETCWSAGGDTGFYNNIDFESENIQTDTDNDIYNINYTDIFGDYYYYDSTTSTTEDPSEPTHTTDTIYGPAFDYLYGDIEVPNEYNGNPALLFLYFGRTVTSGNIKANSIVEQCGNTGCDSTIIEERCFDPMNGIGWPKMTINATTLTDGQYFIGISGDGNAPSNYRLKITCVSEYTAVYFEDLVTMFAVVGGSLGLIFLILSYIYCKSIRRYKRHIQKTKTNLMKSIDIELESNNNTKQEATSGQTTASIPMEHAADESVLSDNIINEDELNIANKFGLDNEESHSMFVMLQAAMKDYENLEGLDIYQLLSYRQVDDTSYEAHPIKCCTICGCNNCMVLGVSKYHSTLFQCVIVAILQSAGLSVILFNVVLYYFKTGGDLALCEYTFNDWRLKGATSMKLLSFLWCAVIAFSITKLLGNMYKNGFNRMLPYPKIVSRVKVFDPFIAQIGVLINFYALLLAIFGSFFIIYKAEGGTNALDMVLNAVALFFILELDDFLVLDSDYDDCMEGIKNYIALLKDGKKYNDYYNEKNKDPYAPSRCCGFCVTISMIRTGKWLLNIAFWVVGVSSVFAPFIVMICF